MFFAAMIGCKSTSTNAPQGATGNLQGTVGLYDAHGKLIADKSGVLIQAEGTSFSALSDTGGNWNIPNLPAQKYSISFSKSGYGTVKNTSYNFAGGDTVLYGSRVYLYQPIAFSIVIDSVSAVSDTTHQIDNYGYIRGHIEGADLADSTIIQAYVFFGRTPTINIGDTSTYIAGLLWNNARPIPLTKRGSLLTFEGYNWEACEPNGWAKKDLTVYLKAFALTSYYSPRYYDSVASKWIYPNPPPASAVKTIVIQ